MDALFYITIGIFLLTYIVIITEKIHRTVTALSGAMLLILLGVISQEQAIEGIDFNTIGLLVGMMVIISLARHSGVFQFVAIWAAKKGKGRPIPIFLLLGVLTAVFSALLDNVTTVLLLVPVLSLLQTTSNSTPYLFLLVLSYFQT